jgi:glycosyltransferase involved in cell wall biosynthesis
MSKILYISPENTVGTLELWKKIHEGKGNYCRSVTFFSSPKNYKSDICLNLPMNFTKPLLKSLRHNFYKFYRGKLGYHKEKNGYPPTYSPEGKLDKLFFKFKDRLNEKRIYSTIEENDLLDYDIYHLESGIGFFKDSRIIQKLAKNGKKIVCHYHGEDLRTRGIIPQIDKISDLNLTNEVDLLDKHPNINYIFLPFETKNYFPKMKLNKKLVISHAPTNRYYKGSNIIIPICNRIAKKHNLEFKLIENLSHTEAMKLKSQSDIFIDQIGDKGGWGYGMNSVESLSMGICTLTTMNKKYQQFIPNHPFVNVNKNNLELELEKLILRPEKILEKGKQGRSWVVKYHDIENVGNQLYKYYEKVGIV